MSNQNLTAKIVAKRTVSDQLSFALIQYPVFPPEMRSDFAVCHVALFSTGNNRVVLLSDMPFVQKSITNSIEGAVTAVVDLFKIDRNRSVFIEHYPNSPNDEPKRPVGGDFSWVTFSWQDDGHTETAYSPSWSHISIETIPLLANWQEGDANWLVQILSDSIAKFAEIWRNEMLSKEG